jgi:hypothetical protein
VLGSYQVLLVLLPEMQQYVRHQEEQQYQGRIVQLQLGACWVASSVAAAGVGRQHCRQAH